MKFFVPGASECLDPEWIWAATRAGLLDLGLPTTRRRIQALALGPRGKHRLEVGGEIPDGGGPVFVILEASNVDVFYVCTPWRGVLEGPPYVLGLSEDGRAIDFDEEVAGHA